MRPGSIQIEEFMPKDKNGNTQSKETLEQKLWKAAELDQEIKIQLAKVGFSLEN